MGRRSGCEGMDMSMITTLFCGDVSRTQMNLSDSIVTCVKVMNCWLMPRLVSVSTSFIVMGALAVAMATEDNERDAQYKLSLAQSFDQEPRKEDPQETLTCVHACANQKEKKTTTMHRRRRRRTTTTTTTTTTVFLSFFPPTRSRDPLSEIDQTNAIPLPKSKQIII